jgi:hypothetical protein
MNENTKAQLDQLGDLIDAKLERRKDKRLNPLLGKLMKC